MYLKLTKQHNIMLYVHDMKLDW